MKKKLLSLLIASACVGVMPSAFAADDAAIMKRLDKLEAQRKADQAEIDALRSKVQQLESQKPAAGTAVSSDEAAKLHEEIVNVDKKAESRVESVKHSIDTEREKLKVNGYMSVYGVKSTDSAVTLGKGIDNHISFSPDSKAAVQFDYQVNSNIDAVVQMQSAGDNDYQLTTPWAFLRYNVSPSTKIRVGRMVAPIYLYADSIDVGYTYPWARPPVEMYGTAPINYQGVDLLQNFNFGHWNNTLQFLYGDNNGDVSGVSVKGNYLAGVGLTLNNDAWTIRTSYTHADNVVIGGGGQSAGPGAIDYLSGAVRFDDGALFALVEGKHVRTNGKLNDSLPTVDGFYTTLGYQIDAFMPYATWAKAYSVDDGNLPTFLKQSQQSLSLGLRYNLTDKVVIKGEATKYSNFDGTPGITSFTDLGTYLSNPAISQRLDQDGVTLMSFGFDAIF